MKLPFSLGVVGTSAAILFTLLLSVPVQAAVSGELIKGSSSAVYYFGADGNRYAFPTEQTYFSWYADFSGVRTIPDSELASYQLGGNVTYRPGAKLLKITTNPKVYAVGGAGTLRWIQTEQIARDLYGINWAQEVNDIPDTFFINYREGSSVAFSSDYNRAMEMSGSATINQDKGLTAPVPTPTPTPTPTPAPTSTSSVPDRVVYLSSSKYDPRAGEMVTLSAIAANATSVSLGSIKIYFDGVVYRTCGSSPCTTDITLPISGTKSSYDIRAEAEWLDTVQRIATSTLTLGSGTVGVTLSITRPEVQPNTTIEAILRVDSSFVSKYIDIYMDGGLVRACTDLQECRYTATEMSATGTVHSLYGIARDANGFIRRSETRTISVVNNPRPTLTILTGKNSILRGETVDVTVEASDDDGLTATEIWSNGSLLKRCSFSRCTLDTGPWNESGTLTFIGKAIDTQGAEGFATSSAVLVQ